MRDLIALLIASALVASAVLWWTSGLTYVVLIPGIFLDISSLPVLAPLAFLTVLLAIAGLRVADLVGGRESR